MNISINTFRIQFDDRSIGCRTDAGRLTVPIELPYSSRLTWGIRTDFLSSTSPAMPNNSFAHCPDTSAPMTSIRVCDDDDDGYHLSVGLLKFLATEATHQSHDNHALQHDESAC